MHTRSLLMSCLLLAAVTGCSAGPKWPDPEKQISQAMHIDNALELRVEPGPIDVSTPDLENHLSLSQAMEQVLRHSPTIQRALWRVREAQAEAKQARLLPNPILSVMIRWPEGGGSPMVEAGLTAELLSLLKKPGQIRAADHQMRAVSAQAVVAILDELTQLQLLYAQIQALDALTPILEQRLNLLEQMVSLAQSRLEAGEGTRVDVTTLSAQQVELKIELALQQQAQQQARLELARRIGRPSAQASWSLDVWQLPKVDLQDETPWLLMAMQYRPELQAAVSELEAMGARVKLNRLDWIGSNDAGIEAERSEGHWAIGPTAMLALPIFDWGQAQRKVTHAQRQQAVHQYLETQRQIIQEVRQAYITYTSNRRVLEQIESQLLPLLNRRQEEVASAYRAGQSDALAVILSQNDLQAANARLIELRQSTAESFIRLTRAIGGPGRVPSSNLKPLHDLSPEEKP